MLLISFIYLYTSHLIVLLSTYPSPFPAGTFFKNFHFDLRIYIEVKLPGVQLVLLQVCRIFSIYGFSNQFGAEISANLCHKLKVRAAFFWQKVDAFSNEFNISSFPCMYGINGNSLRIFWWNMYQYDGQFEIQMSIHI